MITLQRVRKTYLATWVFLELQIAACCSITVVYAYSHLSSKENAIIKIIAGLMALAVLTVGKNKSVRRFVINHCALFMVLGIIIDGSTELALLISPFTKLVCDVIALGSFFKLYKIQNIERINVIFNKDQRVTFDLDVSRAGAIGVIAGGFIAFISPEIPIETVIWIAAIWTSLTYITSYYRFWLIDRYMKERGLVCPCMKN